MALFPIIGFVHTQSVWCCRCPCGSIYRRELRSAAVALAGLHFGNIQFMHCSCSIKFCGACRTSEAVPLRLSAGTNACYIEQLGSITKWMPRYRARTPDMVRAQAKAW